MKKWVIIWFSCLLVFLSLTRIQAQQNPNELDYKDQVGYLSPDNEDWSENFQRCNENMPIGQYSSSAKIIFKENKSVFRKFIIENFNDNDFTDSGLLNLRFIINCHGDIGDIEVNELSFDFEPINLNDVLVKKLKELSFRKENWNYNFTERQLDYYMYLIFRIENGKVVEILP